MKPRVLSTAINLDDGAASLVVGEQNRCRLGEGTIPLKQIVAALKAAGYDGYYDVELLGEEIEAADNHDLLEHAKQAFDDLVIRC